MSEEIFFCEHCGKDKNKLKATIIVDKTLPYCEECFNQYSKELAEAYVCKENSNECK